MLNYEQFSKPTPTQNPLSQKRKAIETRLTCLLVGVFFKAKASLYPLFVLPLCNMVFLFKTRKQFNAFWVSERREAEKGDMQKSSCSCFFTRHTKIEIQNLCYLIVKPLADLFCLRPPPFSEPLY